jgi:hypothetical protein
MSVVINGSSSVVTNSGAVYDGIQRGTAVTASGTQVNFTDIPSWVKRITVMFYGVSSSSTSNWLIQIGSGSVTTSGYNSASCSIGNAVVNSTAGLIQSQAMVAATSYAGVFVITNVTGNLYCGSGNLVTATAANNGFINSGYVTLGGTLDRVRITTVNGTDTFDAGSINILFE